MQFFFYLFNLFSFVQIMDSTTCEQQLAEVLAALGTLSRKEEMRAAEEVARDGTQAVKVLQLKSVVDLISAAASTLQVAANSNFTVEVLSTVQSPLMAMLCVEMAQNSSHWGRYVAYCLALCVDPLSVSLYYGIRIAIHIYCKTSAFWQRICGLLGGGGRNTVPFRQGASVDAGEQAPSLLQRARGMLPFWPTSGLSRVIQFGRVAGDIDNAGRGASRGDSDNVSFPLCSV